MNSLALILCGTICDNHYRELISWLCKESDIVTFNLPKYDKKILTKKNKKIFPESELSGLQMSNDLCDCYSPSEELKTYFCSILDEIILSYLDVEYAGTLSIYENEVVVLKSNENVKNYLMKESNLYEWKYPKLPEDMCFYKNDKCIAQVIAHEQYCFIFDIKHSKKKLREIGIETRLIHLNRPKLSLTQ